MVTAELRPDNGETDGERASKYRCPGHPISAHRRESSPGLGVGGVGLDGVVAGAAIHLGIGGAIDGVDLVIAIVAEKLIRTETADDAVVSRATVEDVCAAAADDGVSAAAAIDGRRERR